MSSKRVRVMLMSGIVLIALIIGAGMMLTYFYRPMTVETLPEPAAGSASGTPGPNDKILENVTVGVDNVQAVIETLRRPESYSRTITVENFFADGGSAGYVITAAVRGRDTAMKIDGSGFRKNVILAGGTLYIWYDGDKDYYTGPAEDLGTEPGLSDEFQMVPTYETILALEKDSILDAGFTDFGGENCIYVKYVSGSLGYVTIGYISVKSGLLIGAEQFDGSSRVYSMTASDFVADEPDGAAFTLPDGKNALSVP